MTFYVSKASFDAWKTELYGVEVVIIGSGFKPLVEKKTPVTPRIQTRYKGKNYGKR